MDRPTYKEIQLEAYYIGLFRDRMKIPHTQDDDYFEAEKKLRSLRNLSIKYLNEEYRWNI